jgi:hypothetical protein
MDLRRRILKEIEKQEAKIAGLNFDLTGAEAYLQAQRDMLKLLPRESNADASAALRPTSDLAKARDIIREAGKPMHVTDILKGLGKEVTRDSRASLASSIGAYVRRNEIFTRPVPNTFGLVEFNGSEEVSEPPENFGQDEQKAET